MAGRITPEAIEQLSLPLRIIPDEISQLKSDIIWASLVLRCNNGLFMIEDLAGKVLYVDEVFHGLRAYVSGYEAGLKASTEEPWESARKTFPLDSPS
jgi:hypothetical protein